MDTNLPNLDIVEDINEIMKDDEPTPEKVAETIDAVENIEEEDNSPFVQPEKKKKELSEKQKAHLEKIRVLAQEKKQAKMKAKQEALEKVNAEHKPRSYKPKKQKKTEEQKKYEERTVKMDIKEPREEQKENIKNSTPDDFVKSHKEKLEKERISKEEQEKLSFMNFMGNMEKYLILKDTYETRKKNKTANNKPKENKAPEPEPVPIVIKEEKHPFSNYFG